MVFENSWDDFDFHFGPFRFGVGPFASNVRYRRTENAHVLRIHIDPSVAKEEIKARMVESGIIEVEWPRKKRDEDIPID
jgi:hypothetical protein